MSRLEIFIHTGMGRTGSTFLQYSVFPKFKGIYYSQRIKFRRAAGIINKGKYKRYLISGEMEYKKLERHMKDFSSLFPDARPIIILRRHDEWVASQYRRFVKSGHTFTFEEFFNLEDDNAFWEREWLRYMGNIEILERYYTHKPLVLFYDDLRADSASFINRLAAFVGAEVELSKINLAPKHPSYSEKKLRAVYTLSKRISLVKRKPTDIKTVNVIVNLFRNILRYITLFIAPLLPLKWLSNDSFLPQPNQLISIKDYFSADWEACIEYARSNNPPATK